MRVAAIALALGVVTTSGASFAQPAGHLPPHGVAHAAGTGVPGARAPVSTPSPTLAPEGPVVHIDPDNPWDTTDPDELIAHIQRAAVGNPAAGARAIAAALLSGVTPRVAATGLDALGALTRPEGAEAVLRFLDHRRASLRRHAVAAAAGIHTRVLVRALEASLGDPDPDVRAEAALALGDPHVGDRASVAPLWSAFDRDLDTTLRPDGSLLAHHTCVSIARIGGPEDITRLITYLRRAPFGTMADAFRAVLDRPDLPAATRLDVVNALAALATPDARELLTTYATTHGRTPNPVAVAARAAAGRIQ